MRLWAYDLTDVGGRSASPRELARADVRREPSAQRRARPPRRAGVAEGGVARDAVSPGGSRAADQRLVAQEATRGWSRGIAARRGLERLAEGLDAGARPRPPPARARARPRRRRPPRGSARAGRRRGCGSRCRRTDPSPTAARTGRARRPGGRGSRRRSSSCRATCRPRSGRRGAGGRASRPPPSSSASSSSIASSAPRTAIVVGSRCAVKYALRVVGLEAGEPANASGANPANAVTSAERPLEAQHALQDRERRRVRRVHAVVGQPAGAERAAPGCTACPRRSG